MPDRVGENLADEQLDVLYGSPSDSAQSGAYVGTSHLDRAVQAWKIDLAHKFCHGSYPVIFRASDIPVLQTDLRSPYFCDRLVLSNLLGSLGLRD
ncbi:hypothetical protein GCM10009677_21910 [Sphaerisporangium rubeum]